MEKTTIRPAESGSSCASCRHLSGTVLGDKSMSWVCTRFPPQVMFAPQATPTGQIVWHTNAAFAPIGQPSAVVCGEHAIKGMLQ